MSGTNPYIDQVDLELPKKPYKITYIVEGVRTDVEVNPEEIPYSSTGLPGSLLNTALGHGLDVDHACGGVCACSTCHVIVKQGLESCNDSTDDEEDQLDEAPALTIHSRLGCQCVPNGSMDLVVEVPNWNRNATKEGH
ncbi:MAG: 2Fe-2S iron-sulfur cluster binding domain-containing protein [Candidatus Tectomicrobia bacterium]|nr:2Fe-2S iron-sulfur cluster binding domain-containing protein [Candidatus Tectomicrobia bacterium]